MALIRINIDQAVLSESAKAPGYHFGKINGTNTLVVNSDHKAAVSKCISNARKAQKLAVSALTARIDANTKTVALKKEENPTRKAKAREKIKALRTKSSANVKAAKELLREGVAALKAAGLSALSSPLKASDISLTPYPGKSIKTVRAAQTDSLLIKGKKGYNKPKFLAASKFAQLGQKKASAAKPAAKPAVKKTAMTKDGTGGAYTPAKAKAVKEKLNVVPSTKAFKQIQKSADKWNKLKAADQMTAKALYFRVSTALGHKDSGGIDRRDAPHLQITKDASDKYHIEDTRTGKKAPIDVKIASVAGISNTAAAKMLIKSGVPFVK